MSRKYTIFTPRFANTGDQRGSKKGKKVDSVQSLFPIFIRPVCIFTHTVFRFATFLQSRSFKWFS
ncbi:hypothetical protein MKMG_02226 [Methanogenium sp. MK-MG]|nr:hypothetical protein MKMG_02226 [Methanogenium sp. MK-MG]